MIYTRKHTTRWWWCRWWIQCRYLGKKCSTGNWTYHDTGDISWLILWHMSSNENCMAAGQHVFYHGFSSVTAGVMNAMKVCSIFAFWNPRLMRIWHGGNHLIIYSNECVGKPFTFRVSKVDRQYCKDWNPRFWFKHGSRYGEIMGHIWHLWAVWFCRQTANWWTMMDHDGPWWNKKAKHHTKEKLVQQQVATTDAVAWPQELKKYGYHRNIPRARGRDDPIFQRGDGKFFMGRRLKKLMNPCICIDDDVV